MCRVVKSNIYFSYTVSQKWSLALNANLRKVYFVSKADQIDLENTGNMAYVNISTSYRFNKGWRLNVDLTVDTGVVSGSQSKSNGFFGNTFNISKELFKSKMDLALSVINPFSKYGVTKENLYGIDFFQQASTRSYYRSFGLSINYRFGKLEEGVKKNKRGIVNDDLQ